IDRRSEHEADRLTAIVDLEEIARKTIVMGFVVAEPRRRKRARTVFVKDRLVMVTNEREGCVVTTQAHENPVTHREWTMVAPVQVPEELAQSAAGRALRLWCRIGFGGTIAQLRFGRRALHVAALRFEREFGQIFVGETHKSRDATRSVGIRCS